LTPKGYEVRPNCTTALPCLYLVLVTLDSRDAPYAYFRNLVRGPARGARLLRPVQSGGHRDESAKGSAPPFGVVHVWRPGRRAVSQWVLTRVSEIHTRPRLMVQEEYGITSSFDDGKQRVQPPAMASQDSAVSDDTQVGLFSRAAPPQILTHVAVMNPARCCHLSATSASGLTKVTSTQLINTHTPSTRPAVSPSPTSTTHRITRSHPQLPTRSTPLRQPDTHHSSTQARSSPQPSRAGRMWSATVALEAIPSLAPSSGGSTPVRDRWSAASRAPISVKTIEGPTSSWYRLVSASSRARRAGKTSRSR